MSYIIDRRLNDKRKSTVNRQRFLRRYRKHIREAVNDAVNRRSIKDMEQGTADEQQRVNAGVGGALFQPGSETAPR